MNPAQVQISPTRPVPGPAKVTVRISDGSQAAVFKCADWAMARGLQNAIAFHAESLEVQIMLGAEQEPGL